MSGPVDAPAAALIGGLITGAGIGAAQWFAAKDAFGDGRAWIATSAVAYGAGLVVARRGGWLQHRHRITRCDGSDQRPVPRRRHKVSPWRSRAADASRLPGRLRCPFCSRWAGLPRR